MKKYCRLILCIILLISLTIVPIKAIAGTHVIDGKFGDLLPNPYQSGVYYEEWAGVPSVPGIYSYFYYEWVPNGTTYGSDLYIMNDWYNTEPGFALQPGQYNMFNFSDMEGNQWEFRVYADGTVEVWKAGVLQTGTGIQVIAGWGPSFNASDPHTLYEALIPASVLFPGVNWRRPVLDKDLSTPPPAPNIGDRYLISQGATDEWTGHDYDITEYNGIDWDFETLATGYAVFVSDEKRMPGYTRVGGTGTPVTIFVIFISECDPINPTSPPPYPLDGPFTTLIDLLSFTAKPSMEFSHIIIEWATASEIDNAGFNLWRSETKDGKYTRINSKLIAAKGGTIQEAEYSYTDNTAKVGVKYYYKLEDIDTSGNSTIHGPVPAIIPNP
jgi:hypothetical protein